MATSYINERTAEYYLVPALKRILEEDFYDVAPVFPWLSREFSKISKELHNSDEFSVLAMFPRRPKVGPDECRTIYATINSELEKFCEVCEEYDVPVVAGCSNASTFWDLSRGDDVVWLDIRSHGLDSYLNPISHSAARLREQDVRALARRSPSLDIDSFEELVRSARASEPNRMYGSLYKPVYFLMKGAR